MVPGKILSLKMSTIFPLWWVRVDMTAKPYSLSQLMETPRFSSASAIYAFSAIGLASSARGWFRRMSW
jgi:hypothetical protein